MMKKKLKYEITEYSIYVQGLTRGREQREYLSWKTVTEMLKEFFETCKDVKSQTFEDLKAIYEIREDPRPDDRYGEEIFSQNLKVIICHRCFGCTKLFIKFKAMMIRLLIKTTLT